MKKIGIVGLGLIGGSIFKSLTAIGYDVTAVSHTMNGILPNITDDFEVLNDREIIFVCTPMNKTLGILDKLEKVVAKETIVTDVCSLKSFVCDKERPYRFIPSHPMAGTEHKGFENSFEGLFKGAKWVITPCFYSHSQLTSNVETGMLSGREELEEVIRALGAEVVITTPKEHDEAVALISHMPMVISQSLFLAASENPLAMNIASSGFRDMTRLALSNEEMASDMVHLNSDYIEHAILKLYRAVGELTHGNYEEKIAKIKEQRSKMFLER